jgi:dihydrofolate reductase
VIAAAPRIARRVADRNGGIGDLDRPTPMSSGVTGGLNHLSHPTTRGDALMGKLIYSMITSLDGFVSGPSGGFDWGANDEQVHTFVNEQFRSVGTYLYGRRMYETMVYWETADQAPGQPGFILDYARVWQGAEKVVYSSTLTDVTSERTRIERTFDPDEVRKLKEASDGDLTVDGPTLAAHAIRAGLVDEYQLFVGPAIVGGGNPFFPKGVHVDLELLDERRFGNGVVFLRYGVRTLMAAER